jgi:2-phospho-L-lactate/phosphoenolpyruvate guanylyltransferase
MSWVAVVPVKGAPGAKSRLGDHPARAELADAFALDTVAVLLAASVVSRVYVVTADARVGAEMAALGAEIVPEPSLPTGADPLNHAIEQATDAARGSFPQANVAVFTGDLPALTVADLETALALAAEHKLSMIADQEGTGTTALLALAGESFRPRFGVGSRDAHEAAGHVPLNIPPTASIRRDVDTVEDLTKALHLGVGPRTSAVVARSCGLLPDRR